MRGAETQQSTMFSYRAPHWREHLFEMNARLALLKKDLPREYAFLHTIRAR